MKKISFGVLTVILILTVSLVLIEAGLRGFGWAYFFLQKQNNRIKAADQNEKRILCIGESTTALGGSDSYPSQLERILNESGQGKKYKVLNQGMPGLGGRHILQEVEGWIREFHPDIVIAMMGINDRYQRLPLKELYPDANNFFARFRTYKLYRWLKSSFVRKLNVEEKVQIRTSFQTCFPGNADVVDPQAPLMSAQQAAVLIATVDQLIADNKYDAAEIMLIKLYKSRIEGNFKDKIEQHLGRVYFLKRSERQAAVFAQNILIRNPNDYNIFEWVNDFCKTPTTGDMKSMLTDLIARCPSESNYYDLLASCYESSNEQDQARKLQETSQQIFSDTIEQVVVMNYLELIEKIKPYHTELIIMEYPNRSIEPLRRVLTSKTSYPIIFVENRLNFAEARKNHSYDELFTDHFGGNFGHATALGNRLIAEKLAPLIK